MKGRIPVDIHRRFLSKIKVTGSGCWQWTASLTTLGYSRLFSHLLNGRAITKSGHVVSYELYIGEIWPGHEVCHSCDNTICVNPFHLSLGTSEDNRRDALLRGRFKGPVPMIIEDEDLLKIITTRRVYDRRYKQRRRFILKISQACNLPLDDYKEYIDRCIKMHIRRSKKPDMDRFDLAAIIEIIKKTEKSVYGS